MLAVTLTLAAATVTEMSDAETPVSILANDCVYAVWLKESTSPATVAVKVMTGRIALPGFIGGGGGGGDGPGDGDGGRGGAGGCAGCRLDGGGKGSGAEG